MAEFFKQPITHAWGETGDRIAPDPDKIELGWGIEQVPRQWWNWIQHRSDSNLAYLLQKGLVEWDELTEYIADKSFVQFGGSIYRCTQTGTGLSPANGVGWVKAFTNSTPSTSALEDVTPAQDTFPYFTGEDSAAVTPITGYIRTLLGATDQATARGTLGAQPAHSNLSALAAVTPAVNALPYFTGTSAMAVTNLSAFGRSLIANGNAGDARTTLGLGSLATQNSDSVTITGGNVTATFTGSLTGNASTATKLSTPRSLSIGATAKNFDGSGNVSWSLAEIGAIAATEKGAANGVATLGADGKVPASQISADAAALPLSGGTMTGYITMPTPRGSYIAGASNSAIRFNTVTETGRFSPWLSQPTESGGAISYGPLAETLVWSFASAEDIANSTNNTIRPMVMARDRITVAVPLSVQATISAAHVTAEGNIVATGNVGGVLNHNRGYFNILPYSEDHADGGGYARMYWSSNTSRLIINRTGGTTTDPLTVIAPQFQGEFFGNASTASRLSWPRNFTIGSTAKAFDGSGPVSWTLAEIGAAPASHTHSYLPLTGGTTTGNIILNTATNPSLSFGSGASGARIWYNTTNQNVYNDVYVGNYYIRMGATPAAVMTLTTAGAVTFTGNVTAYSDIRVKTDIQVIPDALDKVKQLRGVTYDRTDVEVPRQTGLIAQELQKVLPEAVAETEDGTLTVAYGNVVGLLVEAIKELSDKLTQMEEKYGTHSETISCRRDLPDTH